MTKYCIRVDLDYSEASKSVAMGRECAAMRCTGLELEEVVFDELSIEAMFELLLDMSRKIPKNDTISVGCAGVEFGPFTAEHALLFIDLNRSALEKGETYNLIRVERGKWSIYEDTFSLCEGVSKATALAVARQLTPKDDTEYVVYESGNYIMDALCYNIQEVLDKLEE